MTVKMEGKKNYILNSTNSKLLLILISFGFLLPSLIYYIKNKTVLNFSEEFCFLLNQSDRVFQTSIYAILLICFTILYFYIIKNSSSFFKNVKQVFQFIGIISFLFVCIIPFMSSDIFYYMGIGRLNSKYGQNPYYISTKEFVDSENIDIQSDTLLQKAYNGYWSNTTVIYGAVWTFICNILSLLSFGNVDLGLFVFKIFNLCIHLGNCYLLYKISKRKIFSLLYGLNPFILLEGIANGHNDVWVVFFILLALYELLIRKKVILSILPLALATSIKYFAVLLLPLFIIYSYKDKDIKTKLWNCFTLAMKI